MKKKIESCTLSKSQHTTLNSTQLAKLLAAELRVAI